MPGVEKCQHHIVIKENWLEKSLVSCSKNPRIQRGVAQQCLYEVQKIISKVPPILNLQVGGFTAQKNTVF